MRFSYAEPVSQGRDVITQFKGLNRTLTVQDGEFSDMLNMTGDHSPVLSPREKRLKCHTFTKCNGIYGKSQLIWADGTTLYYNGAPVSGEVTDGEKTFVGIGAYVLIFPDKKVLNTSTLQLSALEQSFTTAGQVDFLMCDADGNTIDYVDGTNPPEDPKSGDYWLDESGENKSLKRYSSATETWAAMTTSYVKIAHAGIGAGFSQYDGVTILGCGDEQFNGHRIPKIVKDDYIVVEGVIQDKLEDPGPITVSRSVPDMDFFTECNNRVWGCSSMNHEIYACRQGDPFNWNAYEGLSTDSYAATVGTDGEFTGAATHLGCPIFFKENAIHKVMGTMPQNFSLSASEGPGVQSGSHKSMCIVNGLLFYKAVDGVMAYDGAAPTEISQALGKEMFYNAAGGKAGHKYYLSMQDAKEACHLFVFDIKTGLWHREDDAKADWFAACQSDTFLVAENVLWAITRGDKALAFEDAAEEGAPTQPLAWMAETGDMLALMPDNKYVSKLQLCLQMDEGAAIAVFLQYDSSGEWEQVLSLSGAAAKRAFTVPVIPRRCGHLRMKLSGAGGVKVYMISKTLEEGSGM